MLSDTAWRKRFRIGSFGDRANRSPSSRDLHDRRRRACGFHRNTDWLQPRPLGATDPGATHRRQHRNAWPRCPGGWAWAAFSSASTSLATVTAALDGRWKADGRDDIAVVRLIPRGRQWYTPAPESRLRLIGLFSVLTLAICLPQRVDAHRHDRAGTTERARDPIVAWRGPFATSATAAGRAPVAGGARRRRLADSSGTWMARGWRR